MFPPAPVVQALSRPAPAPEIPRDREKDPMTLPVHPAEVKVLLTLFVASGLDRVYRRLADKLEFLDTVSAIGTEADQLARQHLAELSARLKER